MDSKHKVIIKKDLSSTKRIKAALDRANSLTLSVLVELIGLRGFTEKQACSLLNINYKLFRYTLDKDSPLSIHIKSTLNRARNYKSTIKHESIVRKTKRKANRLRE